MTQPEMKARPMPQPIVTVDVVLLTLMKGVLTAALVQRDKAPNAGAWTLPGGWVHTDEDEDALASAKRILRNKAAIGTPYLEQLQTFAGRYRDARGWSASIAYYALVPFEAIESLETGADKSTPLRWRPVDDITALPFDHLQILKTAVARVRSKTLYSSLPVHLMPETFTLSDLQKVYEQVLGTPLDKRTFRRRIEELDIVQPVERKTTEKVAHRPAQCYQIKPRAPLGIWDRNVTACGH